LIKEGGSGQGLIPKSILCLRQYTLATFISDLVAGLTVGLVALPLAMAFAISSGVAPEAGLYTAIIAGFLVSALGGSKCQIGGPTGAFVVVVSGIIAKYGLNGLYVCTVMAGVMLLVLGLTGLGNAVKYIPRPVVIGFTNGIAVLIASTQIKDFFGLKIDHVPGDFGGRMLAIGHGFATLSPTAAVLAAGSLGLLIVVMVFFRRIPGAILALVLATLVAVVFHLPVETIATRFGGIRAGLPPIQLPHFQPELLVSLISPAFTVAILGAVESLLSAVVSDRMSGDKHNSNMELVAQGVANIASPFFGGIPATGAIARTATNIRSGAKTPVAGMIHALVLLLILLVAAPLAKLIPLCVLAAILLMVSYNMGEWREIPEILKLGKSDVAVWVITFGLTVFADLSVAVEVGMVLAALLYIGRVTSTTTVSEITSDYVEKGAAHSLQMNPLPAGVAAFRIHGPFLFGSTDKLAVIEDQIDRLPRVVMLRLRNMNAIDATGLGALENLADRLHANGRHLVLCGMRDQPAEMMRRSEFDAHIGHANLCPTLKDAVERAEALLATVE
jgi:SulP family sulfate permease